MILIALYLSCLVALSRHHDVIVRFHFHAHFILMFFVTVPFFSSVVGVLTLPMLIYGILLVLLMTH